MNRIIDHAHDIGWTEAQELNMSGWVVQVAGTDHKDKRRAIFLRPNTEELDFNEKVRDFTKRHSDIVFKAWLEEKTYG